MRSYGDSHSLCANMMLHRQKIKFLPVHGKKRCCTAPAAKLVWSPIYYFPKDLVWLNSNLKAIDDFPEEMFFLF